MKNLIFFILIASLSSFTLFAQQEVRPFNFSNADDILIRHKIAQDRSLYGKYLIYEKNLKQVSGSNGTKTDTLINGRRIVPVVFHVIHKGGPENISRSQVEDAIALLNIDYNKLNSDTDATHTWSAFSSRRADCKIEFRLAKTDPYGNCTDGIIRHYDPQTNYAYFTTMSQYCWSPSRYLNVFTVAFIYPEGIALPEGAFIGGMSPFPPSNALSQALTGGDSLADGVLIRHDGVGSIGTATSLGGMPINALNRTLTHESGHYFNLYHPFQNLMFGIIPAADGCPSMMAPNGDEVSDTPPVQAATQNTSVSCYAPGSRNTCNQDSPDEPDMIENYMDYQWGYCTNIFTLGQYSRINATMNGDRRKLWSLENLVSTGVLDTSPSVCAPLADFYAQNIYVCAGGSIAFADYSYRGIPDSWTWTFDGGTPATSNQQNPTIQYNVPGTYNVKLMAANPYGSDSLTRTAYVHVVDPSVAGTTPVVESFESGSLSDWAVANDVGNAWEISSSAYYSGTKCLSLHNFDSNSAGGYDEIISPAYDFTTLPGGSLPVIRFRLAYAGKYIAGTILTDPDTIYDKLSMYVSTNCGATWTQKYSKSGINLATVTTLPDDFVPGPLSDWSQETATLPMSYLNEDHVMIKFVFMSNGGNNLYIDDINISTLYSGMEESVIPGTNLIIIPNPVTGNSVISFNLREKSHVTLMLCDIVGRTVSEIADEYLPAGEQHYDLSRSEIGSNGFYFVKAVIGGCTMVQKLIAE